jgi:signal transduction histidine kinase
MNFKDITEIQNMANLKSEAKMVNLYTSTISHEMLTPLKNMIAATGLMEDEFPE